MQIIAGQITVAALLAMAEATFGDLVAIRTAIVELVSRTVVP